MKAIGAPSLGSFKIMQPCGLHVFVWYQKYMHIFVQALGLHMHPQDQKKSTFTPLTLLKTNHGEDTVLTHQMFTYVYMNMATHMQFDQQKPKGLTLTCSLNSKSLMA